jgi:hypothetical protein
MFHSSALLERGSPVLLAKIPSDIDRAFLEHGAAGVEDVPQFRSYTVYCVSHELRRPVRERKLCPARQNSIR